MEFKILINRWRSVRVGFRFDMYAWFKVCEINNIELHQLGDIDQQKLFADIIYSGYVSYCTHNRKRAKYSIEQLADIVDRMTKRQSEELVDGFMKSKVFGKTVKEHADGEAKKK